MASNSKCIFFIFGWAPSLFLFYEKCYLNTYRHPLYIEREIKMNKNDNVIDVMRNINEVLNHSYEFRDIECLSIS
jgi:hypothetical protein